MVRECRPSGAGRQARREACALVVVPGAGWRQGVAVLVPMADPVPSMMGQFTREIGGCLASPLLHRNLGGVRFPSLSGQASDFRVSLSQCVLLSSTLKTVARTKPMLEGAPWLPAGADLQDDLVLGLGDLPEQQAAAPAASAPPLGGDGGGGAVWLPLGWEAAAATPFEGNEALHAAIDGMEACSSEAIGGLSGLWSTGPSLADPQPTPGAVTIPPSHHASQPPASQQDRQERVRAQNRAKQARWRQRQKEKQGELEQQCEAAAAELQRERDLNEAHRLTGELLQAVQGQKDEAVAVLEQAVAAAGAGGSGGRGQGPGQPPQQVPTAGLTSGGSGGSGGGTSLAMSLPFEERVRLWNSSFPPAQASTEQLVGAAEAVDWFAVDASTKRTLSCQLVEATPQLLQLVHSMTPAHVLQDWAEFGAFVAGVLRQLDSGRISEAEAEARMHPATLYEAMLHFLLLTHRPELEHHLVSSTRVPGESEAAAAQRWRQVMLEMGITEGQVRAILPAYHDYRARMERLGEDAATALATLQEVQQSLDSQLSKLAQLGGASLSSLAQRYVGLFEAASTVRQQPTAALLVLEDFFFAAGCQLTPLQKARMVAACRPLHPDGAAVVEECIKHYGLRAATGRLAPSMGGMPWLASVGNQSD